MRPPGPSATPPGEPGPSALRRRLQWVRPGILFGALIVAIALFLLAGRLHRAGPPSGPVTFDRHTAAPSRPGEGAYPEPAFVLSQAARIHLAEAQQKRIQAVQADWERSTAADRRALLQETQARRSLVQRAGPRGSVPPAELVQSGERISDLSRSLAESRRDAWQRAMAVLTPSQRTQAEALRRAQVRHWRPR